MRISTRSGGTGGGHGALVPVARADPHGGDTSHAAGSRPKPSGVSSQAHAQPEAFSVRPLTNSAALIAHLIAGRLDFPQTRRLRRAAPEAARLAYDTAAELGRAPATGCSRTV